MGKINTAAPAINEALGRSIDKVYPSAEALKKELAGGRRLRAYLGIDPTSPHLHLGHAASLWTLRRLQDLGHEIILLAGDFTARIGDPTDKLAPRQPLTAAQIKANLKTFKEQASKIVKFTGPNAAKLMFNSKWHAKMTFGELISLAQNFTVQQMLERDMFRERLEKQKPIGLHEFFYPLMQGYDSVAMNVDIEVGGTDQTFNMLAGRTLVRVLKHKEKFVVTNRLLVDPASGKKLSKTEGSLVNLDDESGDMFGRVMAMPDEMIPHVAELSTPMPMDEVRELSKAKNPRDAKLALAFEVVKTYHGAKEAEKAREIWVNTFSKKEVNAAELPEFKIKTKKLSVLDLVLSPQTATRPSLKSKSEAQRLISQGAVKINGEIKKDMREMVELKGGETLKIGKKNFFRVRV